MIDIVDITKARQIGRKTGNKAPESRSGNSLSDLGAVFSGIAAGNC